MINLDELDPPLNEAVRDMAGAAMEMCSICMPAQGAIRPTVLLLHNRDVLAIAVDLTDQNKTRVFKWIQEQRAKFEAVAFLTEAWTTRYTHAELNERGGIKNAPEPRTDPRRTEVAMVMLYCGNRVIQFTAPINREAGGPPRLGEWERRQDSAKGGFISGRLYTNAESN